MGCTCVTLDFASELSGEEGKVYDIHFTDTETSRGNMVSELAIVEAT